MCWPAMDSSFESSPSEPFAYLCPAPTPVYSFIFFTPGICRVDRGSCLALGHESRPDTGLLALVLEPANHVAAANGLMFAGDVFSTCVGTRKAQDVKA